MRKFIVNAFMVLAAIIAVVLIYASTRPAILHVERSISIKATPEKIFLLINDFRQWDSWTPYNKDPAMKKTYSASSSGKGAHYAWEGNKDVGKGEITIRDTVPHNKLVLDLHMISPFEGRNAVTFSLVAAGDSTKVTWALDDKHGILQKTMTLFFDLDQMIGKDFETGLARLKPIAEK